MPLLEKGFYLAGIKNFFILLFIIIFSGCAGNNLIVKYKTYKFNEYVQLKTTVFKPVQDNVSFKAKIILSLPNGKRYKFYALVYNRGNIHRIFAYSFFGKKIIDIMFNKKNYIVLGSERKLYVVLPNKIDENESLFYFFKEVLKGVEIKDSKIEYNCLTGKYKRFIVKTCEKDNFKKVFFIKNGKIERLFSLSHDDQGFPEHITMQIGKNKLEVLFKDFLKNKDFEKEFFDYIKTFNVLYVRNMKAVENSILK